MRYLGGGEMGERIRAFDWANHPLGPPDEHGAILGNEAPVESSVFGRLSPNGLATLVALDRRSFSPPLRRLPEMRAMVVTVADRQRRRALRVRRA